MIENMQENFMAVLEFSDRADDPDYLKNILEMTDHSGTSMVNQTSKLRDFDIITRIIVAKGVKLNNCNLCFSTPHFSSSNLCDLFVDKINPKIINRNGYDNLNKNRASFSAENKLKGQSYPRAIYVAVDDQLWEENPTCKSNLIAHYYQDGEFIEQTKANQIGMGGQGSVFRGKWHGKDAAFKFIRMEDLGKLTGVDEFAKDLERRLVEIRKIPEGRTILVPRGHFRQQLQEKRGAKWFAVNYEVFVFDLCRMDLEAFRKEEYPKLDDSNCQILKMILSKCLQR